MSTQTNIPMGEAPAQNPAPIDYVVGFLFYGNYLVALIEKTHPAWQKGKWNGVGGKIRQDESALAAMNREFAEEVGIDLLEAYGLEWQPFCMLDGLRKESGGWGRVFFFTATINVDVHERPDLLQMEEERPAWVTVSLLKMGQSLPVIPNLDWLIPLALDKTSGYAVVTDIPINNA